MALPESCRLFVAVPLPMQLRSDLAAAVESWRVDPGIGMPDLRWTGPDAWHVTLAFLGATSPSAVRDRMSVLQSEVRGRSGFDLPTGGLGVFHGASRAGVLWYGVRDDGRLRALAHSIRRALRVGEARPFRPHVTLARLTSAVSLAEWLADRHAPDGLLSVDRVALMRSHLDHGPAWYEEVGAVPLILTPERRAPSD